MSKAIDYISSCGGAGFTWENKTNNFNIQKNFGYFVDTETQAVTATLPSSTTIGDSFYIVDQNGTANSATPIVIDTNGGKIQGSSDPMIISSPYTSIYMVYANNIDGWVVADGKAGDCGVSPTDNIIPVDTTIYVAPSASVDGIIPVGSDVDGDGSYEKPFYSIKRAIEFLENYRIKVGVYVTIRGLPGKYQYNDDHIVEVKHKDAKYIKIKFDHMEPGYYHETTITTDNVTIDSSAEDYDLITFTVNDIGTGINKIQSGDYIRVLSDNELIGFDINASIWCGFYKVDTVDDINKTVTIIFKRDQINGNYSTSHQYLLPDTILTNQIITVTKFSTHVYITRPEIDTNNIQYFITSNYGFGGIIMSASNEEYYNGNGDVYNNTYSGKYVGGILEIYDGVIEEILLNINGFYIGVSFDNLKAFFVDYFISTSNYFCASIYNSTLNTKGNIINNSHYGVTLKSSSSMYCDETIRNVYSNCYYDPLVMDNSLYYGSRNTLTDKHSNFFYNRYGVWESNGSTYSSSGTVMMYNTIGIDASQSKISFFINYISAVPISVISYNNTGINAKQSTFVYLDYLDVLNNDSNGVQLSSGSYAQVTGNVNRFRSNNNGGSGVYSDESVFNFDGFELKDNLYGIYSKETSGNISNGIFTGQYGIYCYRGDTYSISYCDFNNDTIPIKCLDTHGITFSNCDIYNGSYGVETHRSSAYFSNCDVHDNDYGYVCRYNSNIFIYYGSCINNSTRNLHAQHNSHIECYVSTEITNNNITSNTDPTYTKTYTQGSYILQDGY